MKLPVKLKRLTDTAIIPTYGTPGSSGLDLVPDIQEDYLLKAGEVKLFNTGVAIAMPDVTPDADGQFEASDDERDHILWQMFLLPRSGKGHKHGIILGNTTGVIDNDYRGEIKVSLWNRTSDDYLIEKGKSVAQGIIMPVIQAEFELVDELPSTVRGEGGFGHTGG